jgi:hypothetical protein
MNNTITIGITRPHHGLQLITMQMAELEHFPALKIFPDHNNQDMSIFPREGITIISKPQGHLVVAHQHLEKWILAGYSCEIVDLESFSEHWKGCSIVFFENKDFD